MIRIAITAEPFEASGSAAARPDRIKGADAHFRSPRH
jgi:hypothetical protein